jgi:hypothetical protein
MSEAGPSDPLADSLKNRQANCGDRNHSGQHFQRKLTGSGKNDAVTCVRGAPIIE